MSYFHKSFRTYFWLPVSVRNYASPFFSFNQFSFYLWHPGLVFTGISHSTSVHCVYLMTLYSALLYGFCSSAFVLWLDYSALVFDHRYSAFVFGVGVDCRLLYIQRHICYSYSGRKQGLRFKVFNTTFSNISVLSLLSDLFKK